MMMVFSIAIFIALSIIPADVNVFEIVDPAGRTVNGKSVEKVISFTKQEAGEWQAVDLPRDEFGTYKLDGNKLTVAPPEDKQTRRNSKSKVLPMDSILNLQKEVDWTSVTKLELKHDGHASISRKPDQVSVDFTIGSGDTARQQTFIIRWKKQD